MKKRHWGVLMADIIDIDKLKSTLADFVKVRDWEKFHNPKNLVMALAAEAGELLEIFQWMSEKDSLKSYKSAVIKEKTSHELADIMFYLVHIACSMNINLSEALQDKLLINNMKYPVDRVQGSAKKYSEYND